MTLYDTNVAHPIFTPKSKNNNKKNTFENIFNKK